MIKNRSRHGVLWFILLTFGFTWAWWSLLWVPAMAQSPLLTLGVTALGMWGPGLSALLVLRLVLNEDWRTTTLNRIGKRRYYLWAWFLPAAGTLMALLLTILFGVAHFDPSLTQLQKAMAASGQPALSLSPWAILAIQVVQALTLAPLLNTLFAVGEEIGWRGFLLPQLMRAGLSQWRALIFSGMIWGLWHAPVILRGHNYPDHPYLGVLLMTVFTTLAGIILGWLQLASGSVWVPTIAHAALNAIAGLPVVVLSPFDTAIGGMLTSVIGWIPMLVFILWLVYRGHLPVQDAESLQEAQQALWQPQEYEMGESSSND